MSNETYTREKTVKISDCHGYYHWLVEQDQQAPGFVTLKYIKNEEDVTTFTFEPRAARLIAESLLEIADSVEERE